ncbi:UNVERIFIED_CONTAM: hypothetical protein K2H54_053160 [Gekko kuhli]
MDEAEWLLGHESDTDEYPRFHYLPLDHRKLLRCVRRALQRAWEETAEDSPGMASGPGSRDPVAEDQRDAGEGSGRDEGSSEDSTTTSDSEDEYPPHIVVPSGSPLREQEKEEGQLLEPARKPVKGETESPDVDSLGKPTLVRPGLFAGDLLPAGRCPGATREYKPGDPPGHLSGRRRLEVDGFPYYHAATKMVRQLPRPARVGKPKTKRWGRIGSRW